MSENINIEENGNSEIWQRNPAAAAAKAESGGEMRKAYGGESVAWRRRKHQCGMANGENGAGKPSSGGGIIAAKICRRKSASAWRKSMA